MNQLNLMCFLNQKQTNSKIDCTNSVESTKNTPLSTQRKDWPSLEEDDRVLLVFHLLYYDRARILCPRKLGVYSETRSFRNHLYDRKCNNNHTNKDNIFFFFFEQAVVFPILFGNYTLYTIQHTIFFSSHLSFIFYPLQNRLQQEEANYARPRHSR